MAEKFIDYEKIIKIIKEQEEEEEKKCNPPSMSALGAGSASGANKNHVGNNQSSEVVIKYHQYNPVKILFNILIHIKIINLNIVASHIFSLNSQSHRLVVIHPILQVKF